MQPQRNQPQEEPVVVANEPRLFIGQVPADFTEGDLRPFFEPHGTVQSVHIVKGHDGKSKGCAMVTFTKWSDAESALEEHNGKTILPGGRSRPLIVSFANPRRMQSGETEPGIAARKLFVGQVAPTATADDVRTLFAPCGDITAVVMVKRPGEKTHKGCAFVQFAKWAHCELAIETHNGKTTMPDSRMPLVVKFADGKKKDGPVAGPEMPGGPMSGPLTGAKRGGADMTWPVDSKRQTTQGPFGGPRPPVGPPPAGGGVPVGPGADAMAAMMSNMNPMLAKQFGNLAANPQAMMAAMNLGLSVMALGGSAFAQQLSSGQPLDPQQAANLSMLAGAMGQQGAQGAPGGAAQGPTVGSMDMQMAAAAQGGWGQATGAHQGPMDGAQGMNGSGMVPGVAGYAAAGQGVQGPYGGSMNTPMEVSPAAQAYNPYMQQGGATAAPAFNGAPAQGTIPPAAAPVYNGGKLGRGLSADRSELQWKLFVGQVPTEANEYDLWNVMSGFGDICEMRILTKPDGSSKGCAFVTYANRTSAQQAIQTLDMYPMGNKTLRVKYADSKGN